MISHLEIWFKKIQLRRDEGSKAYNDRIGGQGYINY